jgi:GntR family transcriptional regulator
MQRLPIQLSEASGVPYYRQIVDQVSQLIRSGRLEPGAQLPSVRELSSQLLVSLITTRRAYADLEHAGLVVRRQGTGSFVAEEIEMASRDQAIDETRGRLRDAIGFGRRTGLDDDEIEHLFGRVLRGGEDDDDER